MIFDALSNVRRHYHLSQRIQKGLAYLESTNFKQLPPGKYPIDGADVFAIVSEYMTKPQDDCKWEAHRKYIDIQYVASGAEQIGVSDISSATVGEYREESDLVCVESVEDSKFIELRAGLFMIINPSDAHKPGVAFSVPELVKKIVVKVLIPAAKK